MQLEFSVKGQMLKRTDAEKPVTNSRGYLKARFVLPDEYTGTITANFGKIIEGSMHSVPMTVGSDGICDVPDEVLTHAARKDMEMYVWLSSTDSAYIPTNVTVVRVYGSGGGAELDPDIESTENQYEEIAKIYSEAIETRTAKARFEEEEILRDWEYVCNVGPVAAIPRAENYGSMLVSHPSCLAAMNVTGAYGGAHIGINKIIEKGKKDGESATIIVEAMDLGYPYVNKPAESSTIMGRHHTVNGYPVPIYETFYEYNNTEKCAADTISFAWNGVLYLVVLSKRQYVGLKLNGHLVPTEGSNIANGSVVTVDDRQIITIEEPNSGHWFACGCSPLEAIAIQPNEVIRVETALITDTTPTSGASTYFCLGDNTQALDKAKEFVFCFSTNFDQDSAGTAVASALNVDWRTALKECETYWAGIFEGLREKWIDVPAKLRVRGYLSLGQMLCHTYENGSVCTGTFLGAGSGTWYGNFIRDTSFAIKSMSSIKPELAGKMLDFYSNCAPLYEHNSYSLDTVGGSGLNTDNAPTFLLAAGEYYKKTEDIVRMHALEWQLNEAMKYINADYGNHYIAADGHIEALHPHDFGDDSNDYFAMADTKYESMVDILWIAGLEAIAPVYTALGDDTTAAYCTTIATSLRSHLDDFVVSSGDMEGMMAHAIQTDASLDSGEGLWGATFVYGAWLLGLESCWEWCKKSRVWLSAKGSKIPYCVSLANNYESGASDHGWAPFYPLVALLEYRFDSSRKTSLEVAEYFPSGGWPEFITQTKSTDGLPQQYSHAMNFPWAHASVLELVSEFV